ncbi:MAG: VOC family protein [Clostridia bacterium]|nr:VOC family protein [Clostridia bacterium]
MTLEHIALYVSDLEAARAFFVDYFEAEPNDGYHNPRTGLRTYFLTFAGGSRLELMRRPGIPEAGAREARLGYAHVAFKLGSREAVNALTERLAADGYAVVSGPRTTGDGYYESCVEGFEGNLIELTE